MSLSDLNIFIEKNGTKFWKNSNNQLHREDGPAIERSSGTKEWYLHGKLHRLNGPAIEDANGNKYWVINNKPSRLDGPTIKHANGNEQYIINYLKFSKDEFNSWIFRIKCYYERDFK